MFIKHRPCLLSILFIYSFYLFFVIYSLFVLKENHFFSTLITWGFIGTKHKPLSQEFQSPVVRNELKLVRRSSFEHFRFRRDKCMKGSKIDSSHPIQTSDACENTKETQDLGCKSPINSEGPRLHTPSTLKAQNRSMTDPLLGRISCNQNRKCRTLERNPNHLTKVESKFLHKLKKNLSVRYFSHSKEVESHVCSGFEYSTEISSHTKVTNAKKRSKVDAEEEIVSGQASFGMNNEF